ncbi:MAG: rod shape-determining protein RodA [Halobacteriovoraceae bacterium]|nr:rod shape-determining protein RodA [Halobacteriovoraceae bacterium]|tara:strand:+ start:3000 stop:4118 length:1119 start_codon:yes stop_codon:yes gene_type:complete
MKFDLKFFPSLLRRYDFSFFGVSTLIFIIGILNLYSVTNTSTLSNHTGLYKTQIAYFLISIFAGAVVSLIDFKTIYRYSYWFYFFNIALLVLVLILGDVGMGARRWLVVGPIRLQPSELMKISVVLALARWFTRNNPDREMGFKDVFFPFMIALLPAFLIVVEPDLGTGLLILLIFFVIAFYRSLKWKTIIVIGLISLASGTLMYNFGLKEYQKRRITTFLNPDQDARGSGYNAIQSKISIGSGKIFGKGYMKSSQASLNYLPENHTDFVFSVFNEEHGFLGAGLLIFLYLSLFYRLIWLSQSVGKVFQSISAIGIMSIYFWHTFINMGMVMGILPIVGLPLPLMSYGGSSLLTFGIACGLATSISNSRNLF